MWDNKMALLGVSREDQIIICAHALWAGLVPFVMLSPVVCAISGAISLCMQCL